MALTESAVLQGLKEILEEVAGIKPGDVEASKDFSNDLDVDSLSMVEVVVAAEERFGIKIPDEAVSEMKTVGDAVSYIVKAAA
jgi:acyl carrier protein